MIDLLEKTLEKLGLFIFRNSNFMEALFILIYAIEQTLLVTLSYVYKQHVELIISLFITIALSTFAIQKVALQVRR